MKRKGFTLIELLVVVAIIALLISILLPSLSRARELAKRAVCSSNLRGIGQSQHIYANDNYEWFSQHYYEPTYTQTVPAVGGVDYVGMLGTTGSLSIRDATSPSTSPEASHPSRSLFLLIISGQSTAGQFVCPSSSDEQDDMRNQGSDNQTGGDSEAARPGYSRFDFKGYTRLSYAYQVPYGRKAKPRETLDQRMPLSADKGPYYQASSSGATGTTGSIPDERSTSVSPPNWSDSGPALLKKSNEEWRPYNAVNHNFEGQNILFVDGHVDFERKPIAGVFNDNIYTATDSYDDIPRSYIGVVDDGSQGLTPLNNTDSLMVP